MESLNFADGYDSSEDSDYDPSVAGESSDDSDGQMSPVPIEAAPQAADVQPEQRPRRKAFVAAQSYIKDEIARTMGEGGGTKRKAPKSADSAAAEQAPAKKRKTNDKKAAKAEGQPKTTKKQ